MSRMWTIGRHGEPSLLSRTAPVVCAQAARLLRTTSHRSRGDTPYAVALRRATTVYDGPSSAAMSRSTRTFDSPYGVTGRSGDVSSSIAPPAAP